MDCFKWIWQNMKGYRLWMLGGLVMVAVASAITMINPYVTGAIVDKVIPERDMGLLTKLLIIAGAATLFRSIIRYCFQMIFEHVSQSMLHNVRQRIYLRLQELDFEFFDKTKTGDIMARMTGDMDAIRHFVAFSIYMIFENALIFIFAVTFLFIINFKFALILLAVTPLIAYYTFKLSSEVKPTFADIREQFSRLNSAAQENISGNRVVKAFAKEDYEVEKFSKENDEFKEKNIVSAKVWVKYLPILESLAGSLSVVLILVGGIMVIRGSLTMGELVTFNSFIWALNNPMRMTGWLMNDIQRFAASAEKVIMLLNTEPKIKNGEASVRKGSIKGIVEFKNVCFSYGDEKVLNNISFRVNPGQTVAIIGPTGSGKSTLVSLICRFYDCTEGEVRIDDINVMDMEIKSLRASVAVAMQDIFLFSDTIEGNISYGDPEASMDRIQWAAGIADAHEFICGFPEGYDTIVGERGVGLSGGQRQRIALARALLKNPSVIILDDTTSSVDIETEHEIHKTLRAFYKDKTTFIIAHRISSVRNADMILVLDDGKIVEQGRHEELLARRGHYHSVFINQFGDFDHVCAKEVG